MATAAVKSFFLTDVDWGGIAEVARTINLWARDDATIALFGHDGSLIAMVGRADVEIALSGDES